MALSPEQRERQQQRIEDCRELYLRHGGDNHELIEEEMRLLGHRDFHRRSLYRRYERGSSEAGWIERFGWNRLLSEPPAVAGGLTQTSTDSGHNGSPSPSRSGHEELPNNQLQPPATPGAS